MDDTRTQKLSVNKKRNKIIKDNNVALREKTLRAIT